jgi:HlyD family secretion protein
VKKKVMLIFAIVIVVLVAGGLAYRVIASNQAADEDEVQTATVESGSLASELSSSGNTRSGQSATILWQTSGKVGEIALQPGDVVQENQVLAELDPNTLSTETIAARQDLIDAQQKLEDLENSTMQQAQALQALEDAQKALASLKQTAAEENSQAQLALAEAQDALDDAQRDRIKMDYPHSTDKLVIEKAETDYLLAKQAHKKALWKYNNLASRRLINLERANALNNLVAAQQAMDKAFATYNWYVLGYTDNEIAQADGEIAVAQANLEAAQTNWDSSQDGTSQAAVALAEATLADAQREWTGEGRAQEADIAPAQAAVDAQATLDQSTLLAPFVGTITEVDIKTGDLVEEGDAAFRIDDLTSLYIDLTISEVDLASLKVGQPATLEFDAVADKEYTGEVTEIGMVGTVSNGIVNYPVTIRVMDADASILPGMTASVTIITDQVDNALLVPNKAIRTNSGQKSVTVLFEGQQITIPVTVGLTGSSMTEVFSDQLREGDVVVLAGSTSSSASSGDQGPFIQSFDGGGPPGGEIIIAP